MADTVPDDIFALCSRFNLDLDSYRIFPRTEPVTAAEFLTMTSGVQPLPDSVENSVPTRESRGSDNSPAYALGRFTLRNLWTHVGLAANHRVSRPLSDLLQSSILITGATGGAGATSVTATLARMMSQRHQRCGVITREDNAVLPCYFGDGSLLHGRRSTFSVASGHDAPIRIFGRQDIGKEMSIGNASYELDQILVDLESGFDVHSAGAYLGAAAVVIVSVPDVNSVIRARQLKALFTDQSPLTPVISVLNKFDSAHPLHCEIRDWFTQAFPNTVTLCRAESVNEALAEGMTVSDWSPGSDLAQEYSQLLGLLQETLQACPQAVTTC